MSKKRSQYIALTALITAVVVLAIIVANMFLAQNAANDAMAKQSQITPAPKTGPKVIDPVTIALSDLFERKGKIYLRTLVFNTTGNKELPYGGTSTGWDVAEFAIEMNWD